MKRLIPLLAFCGVSIFTAGAQWRYGMRLGGYISTARCEGADVYQCSRGSGFSGGLTWEYTFSEPWALDASLLYTHAPVKVRHIDGSAIVQGNDFLHLPLTAKWKYWYPSTKNMVATYLYTGPDVMIRLDGTSADECRQHTLLPGWNVGIGFDAVDILQIQAGYRFGLGNSWKAEASGASLCHDGVTISVTLLFDF